MDSISSHLSQADQPLTVEERYSSPGTVISPNGWRDLLVRGDNLILLQALLAPRWRDRIAAAGGLRVAYLDPPFLTGGTLWADISMGEGPDAAGRQRAARIPAFQDHGPQQLPTYLSEMHARLVLVRELLADDGSLYLHCDHRLSPYLRLLLDEVFGPDHFVNEIVWHYGLGNPGNGRAFARKHDTILLYAKTNRYRFNRIRGDVTRAMRNKYRHEDADGRYMLAYGKQYRLKGGKPLDSVWDIPTLAATDGDRWGYPTQKPVALLRRIISASSDPGDLTADLCCGSGTLGIAAAELGRRWLMADSGQLAVHVARRRLLATHSPSPSTTGDWSGFDVATCAAPEIDASDASTRASPHVVGLYVSLESTPAEWTVSLNDMEIAGEDVQTVAESLSLGQRRLAVAEGRLIDVERSRRGELTLTPLTQASTDFLDGWALGQDLESAEDGRITHVHRWSTRSPRRRRLDRTLSGPLDEGPPTIALGFDALGNVTRTESAIGPQAS